MADGQWFLLLHGVFVCVVLFAGLTPLVKMHTLGHGFVPVRERLRAQV